MKYLLTLLLAAGLCFALAAQNKNITLVEYFLDEADRGYGKNTLVSLTPGTEVTHPFNIPLGGVSPGFHRLYLRAKNADNQWSTTYSRTFFVTDNLTGGGNIVAAEYFVDADAGIGKNTRIALAAAARDTALVFDVDLNSVPVGFHTLYLRAQNRNGDWGTTIARTFFVDNKKRPANITRVDYYYQLTAGSAPSPVYTYRVPRPAPRLETTFLADAQTLTAGQGYTLYAYATNENGERSLLNATRFTFRLCEGVPLPAISIKSGTQGVSSTLVLTATVPGNPAGVTYQWLLNGDPINGATAQDYQVAAADFGADGARYAVRISLANGCTATSTPLVLTAAEAALAGESLRVYPNPARDRITVAWSAGGAEKAVRSSVRDALGRSLGSQALQRQADGSWRAVLDTGSYPPGTYILGVEAGSRVVFQIFIKQ